jgi:hypothetical protein
VESKGVEMAKSEEIKSGDRFTIEGWGRGAKGQWVIDGRNIATGRKCKAVRMTTYVVQKTIDKPSRKAKAI